MFWSILLLFFPTNGSLMIVLWLMKKQSEVIRLQTEVTEVTKQRVVPIFFLLNCCWNKSLLKKKMKHWQKAAKTRAPGKAQVVLRRTNWINLYFSIFFGWNVDSSSNLSSSVAPQWTATLKCQSPILEVTVWSRLGGRRMRTQDEDALPRSYKSSLPTV